MTAPWPFSMWGMDVIGPINPKVSNGHMFILVAIDYFTKWIEAIILASVTAKVVARFLRRDVIARYGVPATIITDNAKNLNNKDWHEMLPYALLAYWTSIRTSIGATPYSLVYGMEAKVRGQCRLDHERTATLIRGATPSSGSTFSDASKLSSTLQARDSPQNGVESTLNDTTRLTSFAGLSFQRAGAIGNLEGCSSPTDPWLSHAAGCALKAPEVVKECPTPSKPTMLKEEQTVGDHHQSPHIRRFEPNPERAISHSAFRTKFKHSGLSRSFRSILVTFGSIPVIQVHHGHIRVYPGGSGPSWSHSGLSRSFRSILVTFGSIPVFQVHPGPCIRVHSGHSGPSLSHSGLSRSFGSILVTFGSIPVIQVHPGHIQVHPGLIQLLLVIQDPFGQKSGHSGPSGLHSDHSGLSRSFRSILVTFRYTLVSSSSFWSFRSFRSKFRSLRSSRSFGLIRPNFQSFGSTRSKFRSFGSVRSKFRSFGSFRSKSRSLRIHSVKSLVIRVHPVYIPIIRVYPGHSGLSWFMHSGPSRPFRSILVHAFGSVPAIQVYPGLSWSIGIRVHLGSNFPHSAPIHPSKARAATGEATSEQSLGPKRGASYDLWLHPLTEHATKEGQAVSTPFWPTGFPHENLRPKPSSAKPSRQVAAQPQATAQPLKFGWPQLAAAKTLPRRLHPYTLVQPVPRPKPAKITGKPPGIPESNEPNPAQCRGRSSHAYPFSPNCRGCLLSGLLTRYAQAESCYSQGRFPDSFPRATRLACMPWWGGARFLTREVPLATVEPQDSRLSL
ncbi:hypothetical protein CRG98_012355 [Punica granatum]|uniref:Integrase catalytic domain-containing protein n=1 Tax=Punica granatum TaxID=22663 RepID=A0A2I0KFG6_PUNGR|nr:hypothetical protein CRG98_012355 [Punica granatum]